jgi:hypothetical protein
MKTIVTEVKSYWSIPVLLFGLWLAYAGPTKTEAASPQMTNVNVVNTAANPVPTTAQGTTLVSGAVAATQSGAWNVGVSGMVGIDPSSNSVAISGQPTVSIDPGNNTVALLRDPENPARARVSAAVFPNLTDGSSSHFVTAYDVPSNKILVVEYTAFNCTGIPSGQTAAGSLVVYTNGVGAYHYLPATATLPGGLVAVGQQVRLYADPSTTVSANVQRSGGAIGNVSCYFTISGNLVDTP